jgi:hypothetical protein
MECWQLTFGCTNDMEDAVNMLKSPKENLSGLTGASLEKQIGSMLDDSRLRRRYRIFFNNEYYPALIPVRDKMVLLHKAINTLIERGALNEQDREIIKITQKLESDWFIQA